MHDGSLGEFDFQFNIELYAMMSCFVEHFHYELFLSRLGFLSVIHVFTSVPGVN